MILPNLDDRIAWYKDTMRPDDPALGAGISDWAISWEWRHALEVEGKSAWGCMCSPRALPETKPLTSEDVAAKRAHLIFRVPETQSDLGEIERTLLHELGHVLLAPLQSPHVHAEENAMHSLDAVFAKLSPEQGQILARAMRDPKARLYARGDMMPEDKKAEEKPPEAEVKKQEAPRSVAEIEQAIAAASLAGQPVEELVKELVAALVAALVARGAQPQASAEPAPASVSPMGVVDQAAMARAIAEATNEAKKAIVSANSHLNEAQKAIVMEQPTAAKARVVAESYGRPTVAIEAKMGLEKHPAAGGGKSETIRARLMRETSETVKDRVFRGRSRDKTHGMNLDQPGYTIVYSPGKHLSEMRGDDKEVAQ